MLAAGCASTGNEKLRAESEATVVTKLTEGRTTMAEVRSMFGAPMNTSFTDGGSVIWNDAFSNVSLDAISYVPIVNLFGGTVSGEKKELAVRFDEAGVVKRYALNTSDVKNKSGLFNR